MMKTLTNLPTLIKRGMANIKRASIHPDSNLLKSNNVVDIKTFEMCI